MDNKDTSHPQGLGHEKWPFSTRLFPRIREHPGPQKGHSVVQIKMGHKPILHGIKWKLANVVGQV
jgi:hypothetical protein